MIIIINNNSNKFKGYYTHKLLKLLTKLNIKYKELKTLNDINSIQYKITGIILSGSKINLTSDFKFEMISDNITIMLRYPNIPILGICFGHQILAAAYGGKIKKLKNKCKGLKKIKINKSTMLMKNIKNEIIVKHNHNDYVSKAPKDFIVTSVSNNNIIQSIESISLKRFGIQFHIESEESDNRIQILQNFINFCKN